MKTSKSWIICLMMLLVVLAACSVSPEDSYRALAAPDPQIGGGIVTWNAVTGAIGYSVGIDNAEAPANTNYYLLTGLEPGNYTVKVRAIGDGIKSINSCWSYTVEYEASGIPPTSGLYFTLIEGGMAYEVAAGMVTAGDIVIPAIHMGRPVTAIAASGFIGLQNITGVTIPASVTSIGNFAFEGCSSLTSIIIPAGVTNIGNSIFRDCSSLTTITMSATSIGQNAFLDCSSLSTVFFGLAAWSGVTVNNTGNTQLTGAARYYYSETQPPATGLFWRWVNGVQTVWQ
ncbi:MAG: leucine-rich repeat domain-containing protein [Treponema sp.]|nr:leucine-rich repeat domain-containing protein [Treponema sp.]